MDCKLYISLLIIKKIDSSFINLMYGIYDMSAFEKVREMIEKRHNELYEKWKNKNRHSDCDNCDIMCEGYNYENDHKNKRQQFLNEMDRDNYK